jgi:DNA-binding winged helix-turn-helix (wHTH) protein/tetratricopeptide (TPR) repeat protein/TolB-like protein
MSDERTRAYAFGNFRLYPEEALLLRSGQPVPLPPKTLKLLCVLVERRGHLVDKDSLMREVWPNTFVVDSNLRFNMSVLRKALSDNGHSQEFIVTSPKLGYRFTSEVREIVDGNGHLGELTLAHTNGIAGEEEGHGESESEQPLERSLAPEANQNFVEAVAEASPALETPDRVQPVSRTWNWTLAAGAAMILILLGVVLTYRAQRATHSAVDRPAAAPLPSAASVKPRHSVLVLGFRNLSGRTDDDWLSLALAEMMTTELASGGQLRIVSGEEVQRIKSDFKLQDEQRLAKPMLNQIRNRAGADMIVSGAYVQIGREPKSQVRLDLQLQDVDAGETVFSTAVTGTSQQLFALVSRSGAQLRSKLGVPMLSDMEGAQDQAAMPSTPEVARLYSQGLSRLRLFDAPAAEKLLAKSVAIDPHFALGHSALASAWSALGYDEKAKSESRLALDLSLNLSQQEHLLIAGQYTELTRNWEQAVATYQSLFELFPDNADYGLRLAGVQTSAGKGKDALVTLEKLRSLPPANQDPRIDLAQAEAADSLGDFKQELSLSERAIQNGTTLGERLLVARAWTKKSWAMRRLGQTKEAISDLLEAKRIFSETGDLQGVGSATRLIGGSQSEQGNYADAEESYEEAIAIFRRIGDRRALAMSVNGLATAHYESGDLRGAKPLYEQYLQIEQEVGSKINTAGALGNIANVEDARGNLAEARHLNEESLKIFSEVGDQRAQGTALGNVAILLYEQGELEGANAKFNEALAIKRKIGYQRGIAYDLSGVSDVFRAEGNLDAARQSQEEALKIRNQIGEQHNSAVSRLRLAVLDLDDQKPADAEKIATETAQEFSREKLTTDEAAAEEVAAQSFLAQGKISDARAAINHARTLAKGASNLPLSFDISATSARIGVLKREKPPKLADAVSARRELESALAVAHRCGYLEYEYKLGLALGEIEVQSGNTRQGRARLEALAKDASDKKFLLIAHQAAAVLLTK